MRRASGFTLIEVIVALALTALLMAAILLVVRSEIGLTAAVRDAGRGWETLRSLAAMMNAQLASAAVPKGAEGMALAGTAEEVTFLTTVSRTASDPQGRGIVQVAYRFEGNGRLVYRERLMPPPGGEGAGDAPGEGDAGGVLSQSLDRFTLSYVDAEGIEHDAWPPAEGDGALLPTAVIVALGPSGVDEPAVIVARVGR